MNRHPTICALLFAFCATLPVSGRQTGTFLRSVSDKELVHTARSANWSLPFQRPAGADTLHVIAFRVAFATDTSLLTTGDGSFDLSRDDEETRNYYPANDTVIYRYDQLPHDSAYFDHQLQFVKNYFETVSRGAFVLEYSIYPGANVQPLTVPRPMNEYSPGGKRSKESTEEYYLRRTIGHMQFIRDAIEAADADSLFAPFRDSGGVVLDSTGKKYAFCILHAGASFLTDGGEQGVFGQNTPSDMIDFFVSSEMFAYYSDTLGFDTVSAAGEKRRIGMRVRGSGGDLLIDEIMMAPQTSNQDGLNWGIHGILVNQIARQLGIPDLFSTISGISGVGAFCIMDFYGYSAGRGFIPPYPSAWVRAFMGWDVPVILSAGTDGPVRLTAVCEAGPGDTSIVMVPINDHEYYLIENRQRNLTGESNLFNYDTADGTVYIDPYNIVNLDNNVVATSNDDANVIVDVKNYDISLPASGICVWHIDEEVIRDRLAYNVVNADSLYRGVNLVEADGVMDLGITFQDVFYQVAFDFGGAEDVFVHRALSGDSTLVTGFGPFTDPSSRSNDGGHSFIDIDISHPRGIENLPVETSSLIPRNYLVENFVDTTFTITVRRDYLHPGWPKHAAPDDSLYEPLVADIAGGVSTGPECIACGHTGRVYLWPSDTAVSDSLFFRSFATAVPTGTRGDTLRDTSGAVRQENYGYFDSLGGLFTFPSLINGSAVFPSRDGALYVLRSVSTATTPAQPQWDTVALGAAASTYACGFGASVAVGCANGTIVVLDTANFMPEDTIALSGSSAVTALAAWSGPDTLIAVQHNGVVSRCVVGGGEPDTVRVGTKGIGPYTLLSGDCDNDGAFEIVVCDIKQGIWLFDTDLSLGRGWQNQPNDWPDFYSYVPDESSLGDRTRYPDNPSAPSLADINGDGTLEIVCGGTNGMYALNYKGVLIPGWPAYLDNRFWYERGSIQTSPAIVSSPDGTPLVLFSTPTGENETIDVAKITRTDTATGTIYFTRQDGLPDSIGGLRTSLIDSLLVQGDSLILPYMLPGGLIDAVDESGERPGFIPKKSHRRESYWPLSIGAAAATSPLVGRFNDNETPDCIVASRRGLVYSFELTGAMAGDSLYWPQAGYDPARSFAYRGALSAVRAPIDDLIDLYSYPNPTAGSRDVVFRYAVGAPATDIRLDIFTYTGYHVLSKELPGLTTNFSGWNETIVSLSRFGPAVYRCRLQATIEGKKRTVFWKMAVVK